MNNLRKTQLAVAMALAAGILSGCQNNSTREETNSREDAEMVSMKKDADIENRSADKAAVLSSGEANDNEYSMQEDYPSLQDRENATDETQNNQYSANESREESTRTQAATGDETVLFDFDSADLSNDAKESLDALANSLNQQESVEAVTIRGYADATGPEDYNEQLSQRRAESVRNYLRDKGIEANTWNVEGLGEESPVASNDNESGRSENRRVVVEMSADNQGLSSSYSPD